MSSHAPATNTQQIWADFSGRLHTFIARRVNSTADADDILQDVFVRIHRHADTIERQERLTSWLYQVTRNAIIDYYRAPVRRRELLAGAPQDLELEVGDASAWLEDQDAGADDAARELANCLRPMVARLSPHYRDAVTMIDLESMPQKEAALRVGVSLSGMKSRVQRGRQALEQLMHDCCAIETDARGRIMDYQVRESGCGTCAGGCGQAEEPSPPAPLPRTGRGETSPNPLAQTGVTAPNLAHTSRVMSPSPDGAGEGLG